MMLFLLYTFFEKLVNKQLTRFLLNKKTCICFGSFKMECDNVWTLYDCVVEVLGWMFYVLKVRKEICTYFSFIWFCFYCFRNWYLSTFVGSKGGYMLLDVTSFLLIWKVNQKHTELYQQHTHFLFGSNIFSNYRDYRGRSWLFRKE